MAVIDERPPITRERPAFYALGGGRVGDLVTLLHPPYTAWHLSYFALGAAVAPRLHVDRLLWGVAAFALAVGVAAHAFDELHDRPLGMSISDRALACVGRARPAGRGGDRSRGRAHGHRLAGSVRARGCAIPPRTTSSWQAGAFTATCGSRSAGARFRRSRILVNAEKVALPGLLIAASAA